ncbi:MAG: alpha/beta hydrolase-fold protein [Oscillospiraceae bacterium]|nr:alpha/beta hydrolase-fold protein [Oscillospiraceae bacterium]
MALMRFNFESEYLKSNFEISVIMPDRPKAVAPAEFYGSKKKYKVLWLLHGTYGDHTDWSRKSNIELYACEKDLIVVMPSALNSNYSNWDKATMGFGMNDYFIDELMPMVYNWLPASAARADNFISGLSMGGRGALKFAVNYPEKFEAAAILSASPENYSGMTDESLNKRGGPFSERLRGMVENAGGAEAFVNSDENAWAIIDGRVARGERLPRLLFVCGKQDERVYNNLTKFRPHAEEIGLGAEFLIVDGYKHEWRFWDLAIQRAFEFFGL